MTTVTVAKWGNSVGIRLPKECVAAGQISVGDKLQVEADHKQITFIRLHEPKKYRLEDILESFDTPGIHEELAWGGAKGVEIW
ncbi:MAG: AbrB/MazE/SpoVT family DNA-binding domain-containing protein [Desulfovibrionaceae bacterium]|nr:MAG: AbrB/MazE/SpoVT family DNA-binding domain-containing protein [Desulfovibrionaceae bacterium]